MVTLSVLDLAPVAEGGSVGQTLRNTVELAQLAERRGYRRYWLAEHHNLPGVASSATAVVIAHVAAATSTLRVGAGGIMLPNHAPLIIAEQFGTLETLFPGRIDLGLGRAPGTDPLAAQALRRTLYSSPDSFPDDVVELLGYFAPAVPGQRVRAVPGAGTEVPVWILGSSLYGAAVAAALGLPFAFASHFMPAQLMEALDLYRTRFEPSARLGKPYVMLGVSAVVAGTDPEAELLASSLEQAFVNLRRGRPGQLPPPRPGYRQQLAPVEQALLDEALECALIGSPARVGEGMRAFVERTAADELMVTAQIFDHAARLRSYELLADLRDRADGPATALTG
jgi:luciferase family oxidoreductase group 1